MQLSPTQKYNYNYHYIHANIYKYNPKRQTYTDVPPLEGTFLLENPTASLYQYAVWIQPLDLFIFHILSLFVRAYFSVEYSVEISANNKK